MITAPFLRRRAGFSRGSLAINRRYHIAYSELIKRRITRKSQLIVDTSIHRYMQFSGVLMEICRRSPRIFVVASRDVRDALGSYSPSSDIKQFVTAGETAYPSNINPYMRDSDWPCGFKECQLFLKQVTRGDIVLIGAGGIGKIHCSQVKRQGAVAIDIGSVFDGWCRIHSRVAHRDSEEIFSLEYADKLATEPLDVQINAAKDAYRALNANISNMRF